MLERISVSLFHPKFIGKFLGDKIRYIILYFLLFCTLFTLPYALNLVRYDVYNNYYFDSLLEVTIPYEVKLEDGHLSSNKSFYFEANGYIYSFLYDYNEYGSISVCFLDDEIKIYEDMFLVYDEKYDPSYSFDLTKANYEEEMYKLGLIVSAVTTKSSVWLKVVSVIVYFISNSLQYLVLLLFLYILGNFVNPNVRGRFKFIMCVYSMTPLFICDLFSEALGTSLFHFIGSAMVVIYYFIAMKVIVKISVVKKGK